MPLPNKSITSIDNSVAKSVSAMEICSESLPKNKQPLMDKATYAAKASQLFDVTLAELGRASRTENFAAEARAHRKLLRRGKGAIVGLI